MIQFTEKEVENIRKRAGVDEAVTEKLKRQVKEVYEDRLLVPQTGIGNWCMYYFCPDCSVQLEYHRSKPSRHICPVCQKEYTGEPYDSTWWGKTNTENHEAAYGMGVLYLLTRDQSYGRKAAELMTAYARCYPQYQVHGDIPYNGPGKANAQTLDEAVFLRNFALAYDLVKDCMNPEERQLVEQDLFRCGSDFLMEHRHPQIHNHEVIINSALGILGILLGDEEMTKAAVYGKYGILYQLEYGMQEDHIWFEGTFGYHFYALENFFAFEKFARHTPYSQLSHKNYQDMMEVVLDYIQTDGSFPLLNDIYAGHGGLEDKYIYEFAYSNFPSEKLAQILNLIYRNQKRDNLEALLYGADQIPLAEPVWKNSHQDVGSGYTVLRGRDERYLIFKHGNYGGEHDHYDRLGISFHSHGKPAVPDIGTTGYGAVLHYDYYKNTGTHNTVCVGEANQPPVQGKTLRYEEKDGVVYVEAVADWTQAYEMPDSFTIVQWDAKAYDKVVMTRKIAWTEDFFADVFQVEGSEGKTVDWTVHVDGERESRVLGEHPADGLWQKPPLRYLHDVTGSVPGEKERHTYGLGDGLKLDIWSLGRGGYQYHGKGPANPSVTDMDYLIWRQTSETSLFISLFQTWKTEEERIVDVSCVWEKNQLLIKVQRPDGNQILYFEVPQQ